MVAWFLVNRDGDDLLVEEILIPGMTVVVVLPEFEFPTAEARAVLPMKVPLTDASFNAGRVGLLLRGFREWRLC